MYYPESIMSGWEAGRKRSCLSLAFSIITYEVKGKSFADDLNKERGIVSSRVVLLLRSAEIKPLFHRFVLYRTSSPSRQEPEGF